MLSGITSAFVELVGREDPSMCSHFYMALKIFSLLSNNDDDDDDDHDDDTGRETELVKSHRLASFPYKSIHFVGNLGSDSVSAIIRTAQHFPCTLWLPIGR